LAHNIYRLFALDLEGYSHMTANSGSIRTPIPETFGQVFLNYSDTHSGIIRAVIPETSGH